MRAHYLILFCLVILFTPPARAWDQPCVVSDAAWETTHYAVRVPHADVALGQSYTAAPPATLITQHYITATLVYTIPDTQPPITYTVRTFDYSETTDLLGYTPFVAHAPDYAYFVRSDAPFRVWACETDARPHIFVPLISR